jgi:demethylmenaquinone methyltransferase/2-methoxy-6-polyprenyl-1,4-benzoquinol methylase
MDKLKIADFFDGLAKTWDDNEQPRVFAIIEQIIGKINILSGESVLDVGCGTGILYPYIKKRGAAALHIDLSAGMLEKFKEKYPAARVMRADFETVNLSPSSFDKIIACNVFPHFADKRMVFAQSYKFLKPGGALFIVHSMIRDELKKIHSGDKRTERDLLPDCVAMRHFYQEAGFKDITVEEASPGFFSSGKKDLV